MPTNKQKITWQAPEFRYYKKNFSWYLTFIIVAVLVVGYFVYTKDFFAASTMVIIALLILLFAGQEPRTVNITLTSKGIGIDELFYPYKNIKFFWVVHNENHKTLNLETTAYINHHIYIELLNQNPEEIRDFLLQHLLEHEENRETFTQRISHKFKF